MKAIPHPSTPVLPRACLAPLYPEEESNDPQPLNPLLTARFNKHTPPHPPCPRCCPLLPPLLISLIHSASSFEVFLPLSSLFRVTQQHRISLHLRSIQSVPPASINVVVLSIDSILSRSSIRLLHQVLHLLLYLPKNLFNSCCVS